jgi:hypothetical protein
MSGEEGEDVTENGCGFVGDRVKVLGVEKLRV